MKWQVAVVDGRTQRTLKRIYCEAEDRLAAIRIAQRVARTHFQIKKRCQFSASHWHPETDRHLLASGYVRPGAEVR